MAIELSDNSDRPERKHRYGSFGEQYPDYPKWLNGSTWELDFDEDLHAAPVGNFRASLHYQARVLGLKLATKTVVRRDERDRPRRKLIVWAYEDPFAV